jgi:hypothetical protein
MKNLATSLFKQYLEGDVPTVARETIARSMNALYQADPSRTWLNQGAWERLRFKSKGSGTAILPDVANIRISQRQRKFIPSNAEIPFGFAAHHPHLTPELIPWSIFEFVLPPNPKSDPRAGKSGKE